jgi:hypothetical protein
VAQQLDHPTDQVRVLFDASEAESFLAGRSHLPGRGDDPLDRAIRRTLKELALDLALVAECVEIVVEPAPELADGAHAWYAVRFRFAAGALTTAGEDPLTLDAWIADNTPELAFAVEQERPLPLSREPGSRRGGDVRGRSAQ